MGEMRDLILLEKRVDQCKRDGIYTYNPCSLQRAITMRTVATGRYRGLLVLLGLLAGR